MSYYHQRLSLSGAYPPIATALEITMKAEAAKLPYSVLMTFYSAPGSIANTQNVTTDSTKEPKTLAFNPTTRSFIAFGAVVRGGPNESPSSRSDNLLFSARRGLTEKEGKATGKTGCVDVQYISFPSTASHTFTWTFGAVAEEGKAQWQNLEYS
jgi:hypothetical protein